ncbi:MobV family relaxase, partial [Stenotrophomonas maltophilia]
MSQFAILRVGKLKGWGSVRSAGGHNLRTRTTPNADPDGPPPRVLHGGSDLGDAVADRLREAGVKKPRRDAVLCSEMVLTGSPERMASMSGAELEAWAADNVAWLREEHGANLVQVVLHLDERTPHLHAAVVPVNRDGGLSAKRYWGEAAGLSALQTAYGNRMAPHGLQRGVMGS